MTSDLQPKTTKGKKGRKVEGENSITARKTRSKKRSKTSPIKVEETPLPRRYALFKDKEFREAWTALLESPKWEAKGPRTISMHLERLADFPVGFATFLVWRAIEQGLSFVVPEYCVEVLRDEWEYWDRVNNFQPPSVEEVKAFCLENGYNVDAARFVDYYQRRGWYNNNGTPVLYWKSNIVTWHVNGLMWAK